MPKRNARMEKSERAPVAVGFYDRLSGHLAELLLQDKPHRVGGTRLPKVALREDAALVGA